MKNIFKIFISDVKRIFQNVVAVVVIMGLCVIPCLYAWFNIFSNWDPYGESSTSNLKVAVVSEDEGVTVAGISVNICLLYTSDAADEEDSVDFGGRRIIKKKQNDCT